MKKTTKYLVLVLACVFACALAAFAACGPKEGDTNKTTEYTVTFKDGETVVKTVKVEDGKKLAESDIPADLEDKEGYAFDGWFNEDGYDAYDSGVVTKDVTYTAQWKRTAYLLTCGDTVKFISITTGVTAADIPAAPQGGTGVFLGWYNGATKLEAGLKLTKDTEFFPAFVSEASYTGTWFNADQRITVVFNGSKVTSAAVDLNNATYTYNESTGYATYNTGSGWTVKNYSLLVANDTLTLVYSHPDDDGYEIETETYTLTKCAPVDYAGNYIKANTDGSALVVVDGGIVTNLNGAQKYARLFKDGENYKLEYLASSYASTLTTLDVTFDEKGSILISGGSDKSYNGLFVKGDMATRLQGHIETTEKNYYFYIYGFTVGENKNIYVFTDYTNYYYINTESLELNGTYSITADEKEYFIKITELKSSASSWGSFLFSGEEEGTYTGANGTLVLDGFGSAKFGTADAADYVICGDLVIIGEVGYNINREDKTYTLAASIQGGISGVYDRADTTYKYTATFYDFGYVVLVYSGTTYSGNYTVSGNKLTVSNVYYSIDGTWTIEENGNVLIHSDNTKIYVKDGATLENHENDFNGWYVDNSGNYVSINTATKKISYKDGNYSYTANYNGTVLTFKAKDADSVYPNNDADYTVKLAGGTLTIVHSCNKGWNSTDEDYDFETVTETYTVTEEPEVELDAFEGMWKDGSLTWIFDGKGTVIYENQKYSYEINAQGKAVFNNGYIVTCTLNGNSLSVYFDDGYGDDCFTKYPTKVEKDAFAGTWVNTNASDNYYQYSFTFDGYGNVTIVGEKYSTNSTVTYSVSNNVASFTYNWDDWKATLNSDGTLTIVSFDSDGYTNINATFTKA